MRLSPIIMLAVCIAVIISESASAVIKPAKTRADLQNKLSALICANTDLNSPLAVWRLGVFDAQIAGQKIQKQDRSPLSVHDLQATAQALADKHNHLGISYGSCPDGSGWVASQPAPRPVHMTSTSSLSLPTAELASECKKVEVEFVAAIGGRPRQIKLPPLHQARNDLSINLNFLKDGVLSVVCSPKQPSWQGNTLWGLVPVKRGPAAAAPFAKKFATETVPNQKNFIAWINALRTQEKLPPLQINQSKAATSAVKLLASTQTINHDRSMLQTVAKDLATAQIRLVGENRVIGGNTHELYWLLWNSPPHRELLLSKRANALSIAIEPQDRRYLAVLMFANQNQPKKTAPKKAAMNSGSKKQPSTSNQGKATTRVRVR